MVWLNGRFLQPEEARVSVFDSGLLTGEGLFETLRGVRGRPFALTRHCRRLHRGCEVLGVAAPDSGEIGEVFAELMLANSLEDARLRLTVTRGAWLSPGDGPTILMTAEALPVFPEQLGLVTVPFRRNEFGALTGIKSTSYGENPVALRLARKRGGDEAVLANTAGDVCETSFGNLFFSYEGRLMTPPLEAGPLPGVTRDLVLEICQSMGMLVKEATIPIDRLSRSGEIFLTSALRGVVPVHRVDDVSIPCSSDGLTAEIQKAFEEVIETNIDP